MVCMGPKTNSSAEAQHLCDTGTTESCIPKESAIKLHPSLKQTSSIPFADIQTAVIKYYEGWPHPGLPIGLKVQRKVH